MKHLFCYAAALLFAAQSATQAQDISVNISGTVTSKATGAPIANALVELPSAKRSVTTDASGAFSMTGGITGNVKSLKTPTAANPSVRNGFLSFSVKHHSAPVKAELYTLQGRQAAVLLNKNMPAGAYRINCLNRTLPDQLYILRLSIGSQYHTMQVSPLTQSGQSSQGLQAVTEGRSAALVKSQAVVDTLLVSASGYRNKHVQIDSYNATFDIALEKAVEKSVFIYDVTPSDSCGKVIAWVSDSGAQKSVYTLSYLTSDQAIAGTIGVPVSGKSHLDVWIYDKHDRIRGFVSGPIYNDTTPFTTTLPFSVFGGLRDTSVQIDSPLIVKAKFPDTDANTHYFWGNGLEAWQDSGATPTWAVRYPERGRFMIRSGMTIANGVIAGYCRDIVCYLPVIKVSGSFSHTLFIQDDNSLWTCGNNYYGQLGDGSATNRLSPVRIMSDVKSMAVSADFNLMLKLDNSLWACGRNPFGALGDGFTQTHLTPVQIMTDVKSMAAGLYHTLILKQDNSLWACGENYDGQLGDGTTTDRSTPVQIMTDVKSIAAAGLSNMILKQDNSLWACGWNCYGNLGDGTTIGRPTPVKIMSDVKCMATGGNHTLILKQDNSLWACGWNSSGQLGDGTLTDRHAPVQIMTEVQDIAAGRSHSIILKKDNTVWMCGYNGKGRLGDGTYIEHHTPVQVMTNVKGIAAGMDYSFFLKMDNTLWACGFNEYGQLGDGTTISRYKPVQIVF